MPIRTVGLTPGHRWCGGLRSVKLAVNNGKGAHGLVHGPNSLNATFIHQGRISVRLRKLARNLRNGHLVRVPPASDRDYFRNIVQATQVSKLPPKFDSCRYLGFSEGEPLW